jgi:hypothetical protein
MYLRCGTASPSVQVFAWLASEGMGCLTVSHHLSAALPYHTHMLALADDGSWTLTDVPTSSFDTTEAFM